MGAGLFHDEYFYGFLFSQLDSEPTPPSPFNPELDNWTVTVEVFRNKFLACYPPFPGYPIMVGYPVGIGVGAEDLTYAVAELEPGFEFSKMLRWRTYGILVNDPRTFSVIKFSSLLIPLSFIS